LPLTYEPFFIGSYLQQHPYCFPEHCQIFWHNILKLKFRKVRVSQRPTKQGVIGNFWHRPIKEYAMDLHFATLFTWFCTTWCGNALCFKIHAHRQKGYEALRSYSKWL